MLFAGTDKSHVGAAQSRNRQSAKEPIRNSTRSRRSRTLKRSKRTRVCQLMPHNVWKCLTMSTNVEKCRQRGEMSKIVGKCRKCGEMSEIVGECLKLWKKAEKCGKMPYNVGKCVQERAKASVFFLDLFLGAWKHNGLIHV